MKMVKSSPRRFLLIICLLLVLVLPSSLAAKTVQKPSNSVAPLERQIAKAFSIIPCQKITAQLVPAKKGARGFQKLTLKFEGIRAGRFQAEHVMVVYTDPVIDQNLLKAGRSNAIRSYRSSDISVLISDQDLQRYINERMKMVAPGPYEMKVKFSPPYMEYFFKVPVKAVSPDVARMLDKYTTDNAIEGYMVLEISARDNELYVTPVKAIANHMLIPEKVVHEIEAKINPIGRIPVLAPFKYRINEITIFEKYVYMTN